MLGAVAASAAAVLPAWPDQTEAWAQSLFTSAQGGFSVAFPRQPKVAGHLAERGDVSGSVAYQAEDDRGSFLVRVDEYPKGIRIPDPDPYVYELILRAYAVQTSARLVSTTPVRLGGYTALQGLIAHDGEARELRRVLMVGRRIYQISYTQAAGADAAGPGPAFLDSFRIVDPPAG